MRCSELLAHLRLKVLFLSLILFLPVYAKTEIYLKKYVPLHKSVITLSDISQIVSDNLHLKSFIESIVVGKINPGERIKLKKENISKILSENYIDPSKVKIYGSYVVVERKKIIINPARIKVDIEKYIRKNYPDFQIESINIPKFKREFKNPVEVKISEISKTNSYLHLRYTIFQDQVPVKKINVSVKYVKVGNVVVAKREILKGQIITEEDITTKRMKLKRGYITEKNLVVGSTAKINIPPESIIKEYMIQPDFPVKKRSHVKVIYSRNGIRIELTGYALENGQKGQVIKVKNISSGKILLCKVIGENTVLFIGGQ